MAETWHQDRLAINHIDNITLQLGWMWREQPILDRGIDGQIEICDDNRKPTAKLLAIQSKGGESHFYRRKKDNVLTIRLEINHLRYWNDYPIPVLVIGYLPSEYHAYWLYVQDYIARNPDLLGDEKSSISIEVPEENVFDVTAKSILHPLGQSVGSPSSPSLLHSCIT